MLVRVYRTPFWEQTCRRLCRPYDPAVFLFSKYLKENLSEVHRIYKGYCHILLTKKTKWQSKLHKRKVLMKCIISMKWNNMHYWKEYNYIAIDKLKVISFIKDGHIRKNVLRCVAKYFKYIWNFNIQNMNLLTKKAYN